MDARQIGKTYAELLLQDHTQPGDNDKINEIQESYRTILRKLEVSSQEHVDKLVQMPSDLGSGRERLTPTVIKQLREFDIATDCIREKFRESIGSVLARHVENMSEHEVE